MQNLVKLEEESFELPLSGRTLGCSKASQSTWCWMSGLGSVYDYHHYCCSSSGGDWACLLSLLQKCWSQQYGSGDSCGLKPNDKLCMLS